MPYSPEDMVNDLGELLASLQALYSITGESDMNILGAARNPLGRLYAELDSFGHPSPREWAAKIRDRLAQYGYTADDLARMRAANVDRPFPGAR